MDLTIVMVLEEGAEVEALLAQKLMVVAAVLALGMIGAPLTMTTTPAILQGAASHLEAPFWE